MKCRERVGVGQNERGGKSGGGEEGITLDRSPPPSRRQGCLPCTTGLEPRGHMGSGGRRWDRGAWREGLDPHSPTDQWGVLTGSLLIALEMSDREGGGNVCTWKVEGKIGLCELNRAVDWPSPSPTQHLLFSWGVDPSLAPTHAWERKANRFPNSKHKRESWPGQGLRMGIVVTDSL